MNGERGDKGVGKSDNPQKFPRDRFELLPPRRLRLPTDSVRIRISA
jgi:hypothetical protein